MEQGAKPDINFYEDESDSTTIDRVASESSYLASCHIIPEFQSFEESGYRQKYDISEMFGNLLGLAAYEDMYHLLTAYMEKK